MKDYFVSAAPYYAKYRPFYPAVLVADIVDFFRLSPHDRVVDVGAGTGQLAIQLANTGLEVVAVEPDADMIAAGKELAREHHAATIEWVHTTIEGADESRLGTFSAATFGASFHWLSHDRLFPILNRVIIPGGGLAIAGSQSIWLPTEPWEELVKQILQRYLGSERRAGTGKYQQAATTDKRFEEILSNSPFSTFEERAYPFTIRQTINEVLGRLFSTSFANPAVLGDKRDTVEADIRAALAPLSSNGVFTKTSSYYLFLARRP